MIKDDKGVDVRFHKVEPYSVLSALILCREQCWPYSAVTKYTGHPG